jgi:hypothetical protein
MATPLLDLFDELLALQGNTQAARDSFQETLATFPECTLCKHLITDLPAVRDMLGRPFHSLEEADQYDVMTSSVESFPLYYETIDNDHECGNCGAYPMTYACMKVKC